MASVSLSALLLLRHRPPTGGRATEVLREEDVDTASMRVCPPIRLAIPEIWALRELRYALARGGLPAVDKRIPEDSTRIAAFRVLVELLRLRNDYKHRIEAGERCRIVERERDIEASRFLVELVIEVIA